MKLTISGNTPSQKNRKIISQNKATGRPFLRTAPQVLEWRQEATIELAAQFKGYKVTDYPISINIVVWFDSNRRRDLDNALSSIMDALVEANIIEDDSTKYISQLTVQYGGLSDNPRAEIYLED